MMSENQVLSVALKEDVDSLIDSWLSDLELHDASERRAVATEARDILRALENALQGGNETATLKAAAGWAPMRDRLAALSKSRAAKGQSAGDTSQFLLALKKPLFSITQRLQVSNPGALADALLVISTAVDRLAQHTVTVYQLAREDVIRRQQEELLELSTPVVKLWDGVLAVPMIGVLDSNRTQIVMETLLQSIVDTGADIAIIDITGVPTVDTLVAQHLLKTVTAIRLMGADCIISGIRPQIAQTIVHLGIDLQGITTKATLADALALALRQNGWRISQEA